MWSLYCVCPFKVGTGDRERALTSRGPSQTATWLPVGDSASEDKDEVGRGKCYANAVTIAGIESKHDAYSN